MEKCRVVRVADPAALKRIRETAAAKAAEKREAIWKHKVASVRWDALAALRV